MRKLLFLFSFIFLISCDNSNDDENNSITNVNPKKITQVTKNGSLLYKFTYNSDGKISEIQNYVSNTINTTTKIEYSNGNGIKWNIYDKNNNLIEYQLYTFQNNIITKREVYVKNVSGTNFNFSSRIEYINDFNKSKNNITEASIYDSNNVYNSKYTITYTDNLGSSITNYYNSSGIKTSTSTWIKDDKIAWDTVLDPFIYQHEHNNTSISNVITATGVTSGYSAAFTYDTNRYPLTGKYIYTDGTVINYVFTWE